MIKVEKLEIKLKKFHLGPLDITLNDNLFYGMIGNNGAGKSTFIHALCNLIEPDAGVIRINETKITFTNNAYKSEMGIVLSEPYYIDIFTAKTYIIYCCKFHGVRKNEAIKRFDELSSAFDFNQSNSIISNLSSGNKMKVSLMAALIHNPTILVLDEPFTNLDINTQEILRQILFQIKGNKSILITSHNLELVADLCDTFLIMDKGKIIAEIQKSDHANIEKLKGDIKQKLSVDDQKIDLQWLR